MNLYSFGEDGEKINSGTRVPEMEVSGLRNYFQFKALREA